MPKKSLLIIITSLILAFSAYCIFDGSVNHFASHIKVKSTFKKESNTCDYLDLLMTTIDDDDDDIYGKKKLNKSQHSSLATNILFHSPFDALNLSFLKEQNCGGSLKQITLTDPLLQKGMALRI